MAEPKNKEEIITGKPKPELSEKKLMALAEARRRKKNKAEAKRETLKALIVEVDEDEEGYEYVLTKRRKVVQSSSPVIA